MIEREGGLPFNVIDFSPDSVELTPRNLRARRFQGFLRIIGNSIG